MTEKIKLWIDLIEQHWWVGVGIAYLLIAHPKFFFRLVHMLAEALWNKKKPDFNYLFGVSPLKRFLNTKSITERFSVDSQVQDAEAAIFKRELRAYINNARKQFSKVTFLLTDIQISNKNFWQILGGVIREVMEKDDFCFMVVFPADMGQQEQKIFNDLLKIPSVNVQVKIDNAMSMSAQTALLEYACKQMGKTPQDLARNMRIDGGLRD